MITHIENDRSTLEALERLRITLELSDRVGALTIISVAASRINRLTEENKLYKLKYDLLVAEINDELKLAKELIKLNKQSGRADEGYKMHFKSLLSLASQIKYEEIKD